MLGTRSGVPVRLLALTGAALASIIVGVASASAVTSSLGPVGVGPSAITIDPAGNVYTANTNSGNISKITPAGVVTRAWATTWSDPKDIAIDAAGNLYVTNYGGVLVDNTVTKITPAGVSTPIWATTGPRPYGIAIDAAGNLYTTNSADDTVSKITPAGVSIAAWATTGVNPNDIVIDSAGNLYTSNYGDNTVTRITPAGVSTRAWAATGANPYDIVLDSTGNLYVANGGSNNVSKITPAGLSTVNWAPTDTAPVAITIDSAGNLYTANYVAGTVTRITPAGVSTAAWETAGVKPLAIAINASGSLYVANYGDGVGIVDTDVTMIAGEAPPAPPDRASAPTAVFSTSSAVVTITPNPVDARFGEPTSYSVAAVEDSTKACTVTSPETSCTVSGLAAGSNYSFTASARLNSWTAAPSPASVPDAPPTSVPDTPPTPPVAPPAAGTEIVKSTAAVTTRALSGGRVRTTLRMQYLQTGRFSFYLQTTAGKRIPLMRGSTVGTRMLRKTFYAPVVQDGKSGSPVTISVITRLQPSAGAVLRAVLRQADGSLLGQSVTATK